MLGSFQTWLREIQKRNEAKDAEIIGEVQCWTLEWVILETLELGNHQQNLHQIVAATDTKKLFA